MKLQFKSNLDEVQDDISSLNQEVEYRQIHNDIPRVGEAVVFQFEKQGHLCKYEYDLTVVAVKYYYQELKVVVELHAPSIFRTHQDWVDYFRRHRLGKSLVVVKDS